jgi:5-oxoprolinase (ATP-hydrolysing) subunit C
LIRIVKPGPQLTIQDLGRHHWAHWGISAAGAADALSFRAANRLVGNPDATPALEILLGSATFAFTRSSLISVTGGDADIFVLDEDDIPVRRPIWSVFAVQARQKLKVGALKRGARAYLSIEGGLAVEKTFGSAASHLASGLGPAALTKGTIIKTLDPPAIRPRARRALPVVHLEAWRQAQLMGRAVVRVSVGPHLDSLTTISAQTLEHHNFTVMSDSNRMGLRLHADHEFLPNLPASLSRIPTQGVPMGAIQLTPKRELLMLGVDAQTTGGYPIVASVIAADWWKLGQLKPGESLQLLFVTIEEARQLLLEQERWLASLTNSK